MSAVALDTWVIVAGGVALAFVVALAVGAHGSPSSSSRTEVRHHAVAWWRSGVWLASFVVGLVLSIVMLYLAVALTAKVWRDVYPSQPPAVADSVSTRGGASPSSNDGDGSAISNAMTAVGVAIAVVTLVLTIGTSWFGTQQRELEGKLIAADKQLDRVVQRDQIESMRVQVAVCGLAAKRAALRWIQKQGTSAELLSLRFLEVSLDLEQLSFDDLDARRKAFATLVNLLDPEPWCDDLSLIRDYTEECHRYMRALQAYKRGQHGFAEDAQAERAGLACRVFDQAEVRRIMRIG